MPVGTARRKSGPGQTNGSGSGSSSSTSPVRQSTTRSPTYCNDEKPILFRRFDAGDGFVCHEPFPLPNRLGLRPRLGEHRRLFPYLRRQLIRVLCLHSPASIQHHNTICNTRKAGTETHAGGPAPRRVGPDAVRQCVLLDGHNQGLEAALKAVQIQKRQSIHRGKN